MLLRSTYKVISGAPLEIEQTLNLLSQDGWQPVTMASLALPNVIAVILKNILMDEASLKITTVRQEPAATEEIQ